MHVKGRRSSAAARLGCLRQFLMLAILWGIFVAFNALTRKFVPSLELRLGQISVMAFAVSAAELFVAWWISLKATNAVMNSLIARAVAKEEERERLEAEEAARRAPAGGSGTEAAKSGD